MVTPPCPLGGAMKVGAMTLGFQLTSMILTPCQTPSVQSQYCQFPDKLSVHVFSRCRAGQLIKTSLCLTNHPLPFSPFPRLFRLMLHCIVSVTH